MPVYQCKLCNHDVKIEVYVMLDSKDFICPSCLYESKVEIGCSECGSKIKIYRASMMNKCFKCYKNEIIS